MQRIGVCDRTRLFERIGAQHEHTAVACAIFLGKWTGREHDAFRLVRPEDVGGIFKSMPLYFSCSGSAGGVSRKETVEDAVQFVSDVGGNPIITPSIVQRLDFYPRFELPLNFAGWTITASGAGRATFFRRQGQLNLACAQCHDDNWGKSLAGTPIPQAHPTGYPIYRLEWQGMGSLQRRLRNCMIGVRAEPYSYGSQEFVELEYYLMWRARGMKLETPAVRP